MNAATGAVQSPAQRCIRAGRALTVVAAVIAALLIVLPTAWLRGVDGYLFFTLLTLAGIAVVLAVASAVLRGAAESAGATLFLVGVNIALTLVVVVTLFSFRMGAP